MRESFIFHFEYIEDVPEELQPQYAMYAINYARYGEEPELTDWRDKKLWNRTKERIDSESEKYETKCQNLKQNRNTTNKKTPKQENLSVSTNNVQKVSITENNLSVAENKISDTENDLSVIENQISVGVYDSESVNVSESVNGGVSVSDVEVSTNDISQSSLVLNFNDLGSEKDKLFHDLYLIWTNYNMPLCNASKNNEFYFRSRELKDSLEYLRCYSPAEIYEALDNYIALHNYILSGQSWMKQSNASFVNFAKKITDFLNGNFNLEKYANSKNKTENQENIFEKYEFLKEDCK